jgi:RimJ/RimL family protein N-acetyltransferase
MTKVLETERLIIRNWIPEKDTEQVFEMYNDPEVIYFLGNGARLHSIESQYQKLIEERSQIEKNGLGSWAIVEKDTQKIAGTIILEQLPDKNRLPTQDIEVGWHLKRSVWGQGYATEAGGAMLEYGFRQLNFPVIYAVVKPENHASIRVTQRLQMNLLELTNKYYGIELLLFEKSNGGTGDR